MLRPMHTDVTRIATESRLKEEERGPRSSVAVGGQEAIWTGRMNLG